MTEFADPRRPFWVDATILTFAGVVFVTMMGLGIWQVQRLGWKLDLIDAVNTRAFADPVSPPTGVVTPEDHAYLRVKLSGVYDHNATHRVKAVTELGPGQWLMTPLLTQNEVVWINRGFVPTGVIEASVKQPKGPVDIVGLLRMPEVGGTLLESNRPEIDRWVSRDVVAMSAASGFGTPAPFFVDAEHASEKGTWPRGGLTKVAFRNPHLSYALTWFAMAALFAVAMAFVIWDRVRVRT